MANRLKKAWRSQEEIQALLRKITETELERWPVLSGKNQGKKQIIWLYELLISRSDSGLESLFSGQSLLNNKVED